MNDLVEVSAVVEAVVWLKWNFRNVFDNSLPCVVSTKLRKQKPLTICDFCLHNFLFFPKFVFKLSNNGFILIWKQFSSVQDAFVWIFVVSIASTESIVRFQAFYDTKTINRPLSTISKAIKSQFQPLLWASLKI